MIGGVCGRMWWGAHLQRLWRPGWCWSWPSGRRPYLFSLQVQRDGGQSNQARVQEKYTAWSIHTCHYACGQLIVLTVRIMQLTISGSSGSTLKWWTSSFKHSLLFSLAAVWNTVFPSFSVRRVCRCRYNCDKQLHAALANKCVQPCMCERLHVWVWVWVTWCLQDPWYSVTHRTHPPTSWQYQDGFHK